MLSNYRLRMQVAVVVTLLVGSLHAMTLPELLALTLKHNPSLHVAQARLQASKQAEHAADAFSNPSLLITTNSLPSDQAMSQSVLTLSQRISVVSKRTAAKTLALSNSEKLRASLHQTQTQLIANVKRLAYQLWQLEQSKKIIARYQALSQANISLYATYSSINAKQHMGMMKAELALTQLAIKQANIDAAIVQTKTTLQQLSDTSFTTLDIQLHMPVLPTRQSLLTGLDANPQSRLLEHESNMQRAQLHAAKLNRYPDLNIIASYAHREQFSDYVNVGIGLSLPIYDTETNTAQTQKKRLLVATAAQKENQHTIHARFDAYYAQLKAHHTIYHLINDEALPNIAHMLELSNSALSTGGDLFKSIDVLFEQLAIEQQRIDALAAFHINLANIEQLQGKTQ